MYEPECYKVFRMHITLFQSLGKTEGSVYDSPRAMAKLLKEAQRVKQVLSANTDHQAQVIIAVQFLMCTSTCYITIIQLYAIL